MEGHRTCLNCLFTMMYICFSDDDAAQCVDILRETAEQYRDLFMQLYGLVWARPKLHSTGHLADQIAELGSAVNCFKPERDHKRVRSFGNHTQGDQYLPSLVHRSTLQMLSEDNTVVEEFLHAPKPGPELRCYLNM
eukprot:845007-Karenia_brevis.AAC.1